MANAAESSMLAASFCASILCNPVRCTANSPCNALTLATSPSKAEPLLWSISSLLACSLPSISSPWTRTFSRANSSSMRSHLKANASAAARASLAARASATSAASAVRMASRRRAASSRASSSLSARRWPKRRHSASAASASARKACSWASSCTRSSAIAPLTRESSAACSWSRERVRINGEHGVLAPLAPSLSPRTSDADAPGVQA
mmetsp:Transcript_90373/g.255102  ORF Transcript_90373/g.255102 Transcript_90373/m.255102 type:complete len:207 (-) Transcript_90373:906-1526(-)